jgi:hypothetical protein
MHLETRQFSALRSTWNHRGCQGPGAGLAGSEVRAFSSSPMHRELQESDHNCFTWNVSLAGLRSWFALLNESPSAHR